jgi:hypothetical protein
MQRMGEALQQCAEDRNMHISRWSIREWISAAMWSSLATRSSAARRRRRRMELGNDAQRVGWDTTTAQRMGGGGQLLHVDGKATNIFPIIASMIHFGQAQART